MVTFDYQKFKIVKHDLSEYTCNWCYNCSLTKPPSSGNQKSNLFFCLFVWSIIDLQHYVSFFLHGIVIQYFYTFWTDKHQKSSYDMPSYKHIM